MYCEIVYFIEENNCEKRHADLKLRGYNCFWNHPVFNRQKHILALEWLIVICINCYRRGVGRGGQNWGMRLPCKQS